MTSTLYSSPMNRSMLPEAVQIGKHYSFRADIRLNTWAFVAVLMAVFSRIWLHRHQEWDAAWRAILALSPLLPSLLYVRSVAQWIGGMDELQGSIQLKACLFATIGTIFVATAFSLLEAVGIFHGHGLGWEGAFASVVLLYVLGNIIFNRRYQ